MKLTKLILSGFKSFADRTEFEFDDGVTCVVGPNGCGKSNIVDAVKWVLGEQSAKNLRGTEMADVIFNGTVARRPAGMAEVTLVFDNTDGMLQPVVSDDKASNSVVSVTRRLYRSGQSDYLINKIPCRRRDIREMFMDTGIGRDAYSLIEQGRVELFLQASHDERRAIFDEAAGISKYKAPKNEALRKLERVEQNLLRLNDILGEVQKRLRSIKYQAGKARNYQVYSERLKDLRSLYFLAQYHQLSQQRGQLQGKLDDANDRLVAIGTRIDQLDTAQSGTEVELLELERTARDVQSQLAAIGGRILSCQQRAEMLAGRVKELGEEIAAASSRREQFEAKIEQADQEIAARTQHCQEIEAGSSELADRYEGVCEEHSSGDLAITCLEGRLADEKAGTIDLLRRTAQLHNEINGLGIRRENLQGRKARLADQAERTEENLREALTDRAKIEAKLSDIRELLAATQQRQDETQDSDRKLNDEHDRLSGELAELRERCSAVISRVDVLQEMQRRLEGVSAGQRVLEAKQTGKIESIRGMLGQFLDADMQYAAMVEAALAGAEQHLVAMSFENLLGEVRKLTEVLADGGAAEVVCMDRLGTFGSDFDFSDCRQVRGRAIDYVRFEPWLGPLLWRLLGRTLVVSTLAEAAAVAEVAPEGYRFVTIRGELLEPDGRVRLGSAKVAAGVVTRRSELAALQQQAVELDEQIRQLQEVRQRIGHQRQHLEELKQQLRTAIYETSTERVESESRFAQLDERIAQLQQERPLISSDLENLTKEIQASVHQEHEVKEKAAELEMLNSARQAEIDDLNARIAAARQHQEELAARMTELKVAFAQAEEKKQAIRQALVDLGRQREQIAQELERHRSEIQQNRARRADAETAIAKAREETDALYEQQRQLDRQTEELEETRRGLQERLQQMREQLARKREDQKKTSQESSNLRLEQGEADVRIENLIARAADEMNMNLLELYPSYQHDEQRDWDAVAAEVQELRGKIERLGNVNLDAIAEQEELQKRQDFLKGQLEDVQASQRQITELIRKINKTSREMFLKSFDAVRENFRHLFRKLFGGGRADIFLVDEENVLESGIEIVAQPPGKELRSLSLLSGGEKTMTALALLFSIFKSRPSPFCLLDEVDAALDEANNERFNHLVCEFVAISQIVVISHAKRTMSMANVLYGVTMQEAGVSKRISVRFEDAAKKPVEQLAPVGV